MKALPVRVKAPHVTIIKLPSILPAVHALVLLVALLIYRTYYTPSNGDNSTMSVSFFPTAKRAGRSEEVTLHMCFHGRKR